MKTIHTVGSVLGLAALLTLGGCDTMVPANTGASYPQTTNTGAVYGGYGVVQSIEIVRQGNTGIGGSGIGAGAIVGAVVGGLVGNQVGGGTGKTAATVIGAAGGAYAGNELEKRNQTQQADAYKFTIRMNDGSYQAVTQATIGDIRVGDRVRIENGVARRY
jgi:outer membrane lipoprotein SlyB